MKNKGRVKSLSVIGALLNGNIKKAEQIANGTTQAKCVTIFEEINGPPLRYRRMSFGGTKDTNLYTKEEARKVGNDNIIIIHWSSKEDKTIQNAKDRNKNN